MTLKESYREYLRTCWSVEETAETYSFMLECPCGCKRRVGPVHIDKATAEKFKPEDISKELWRQGFVALGSEMHT